MFSSFSCIAFHFCFTASQLPLSVCCLFHREQRSQIIAIGNWRSQIEASACANSQRDRTHFLAGEGRGRINYRCKERRNGGAQPAVFTVEPCSRLKRFYTCCLTKGMDTRITHKSSCSTLIANAPALQRMTSPRREKTFTVRADKLFHRIRKIRREEHSRRNSTVPR